MIPTNKIGTTARSLELSGTDHCAALICCVIGIPTGHGAQNHQIRLQYCSP
jgi:hypothetical protein